MTSDAPVNQKSTLQRLSRVLPGYFSSEWSLAQFRVPDFRCTAAFGADPHTVVIVCANGSYYKARFDPVKGGEMVREEFAQFDDASVESTRGDASSTSAAPAAAVAKAAPARAEASAAPSSPEPQSPISPAEGLIAATGANPIVRGASEEGTAEQKS